MTGTGEDWPDTDEALRTWLRNDPGLVSTVGRRVYWAIPDRPEYPLILITRIGGGESGGEAPLEVVLIQFDVYGRLRTEPGGGKRSVTGPTLALKKAISKIKGETPLTDAVTAFNARVSSDFDSPLPKEDRPRRIVTAVIPMIARTS